MNKGIGGHHSPKARTVEWLTPPKIIGALGQFDLDPCAAVDQPWPTAETHYTIKDNGLVRDWFGRVWCNPPYGTETATWLKKMAEHGDGIALTFARTDTGMFFDWVWDRAEALLFIKGRLHFYRTIPGQMTFDGKLAAKRMTHNSGGPSVLVAYGIQNVGPLRNSGIDGKFIWLAK